MKKFFNKTNINERTWLSLENDRVMIFFGNQMNLSDLPGYTKTVNQVLESISIYGVINLSNEDQKLRSEEIGEK